MSGIDPRELDRLLGSQGGDRYSREGRVRLLAEAATALLAGRRPSREAATFLGAGLLAWLQEGGDLLGDYWKVSGPAGSHRTAQWVHRNSGRPKQETVYNNDGDINTFPSSRGQQGGDDTATLSSIDTSESKT